MATPVRAALPRGDNGEAIQVLAPVESTPTEAAIGAGNAAAALPADSEVVEVSVSASCRFAFGTSGVDATSGTRRLLHKGVYVYRVPTGATHYAVTQFEGSSGTATVGRLV